MKVAVITPTCRYGGLDVTFASLMAQSKRPDLWIIADDLKDQRAQEVFDATKLATFTVDHYLPRVKPDGWFSDLPHTYNDMLTIADYYGCDLAVSVQDYTWLPRDGIWRFVTAYMEHGPNALYTGLCDISAEPRAEAVVDRKGRWTVFHTPTNYDYDGKPEGFTWEDIRRGWHVGQKNVVQVSPLQWEMNWAAIPVELFALHGIMFPEEYGEGLAHENIVYALEAGLAKDTKCLLDPLNCAVSLPHRLYFPEEDQLEHRAANEKRFWHQYGDVVRMMA